MLWRDTGKPRQGQIFDMMQQSRARFKYVIRAVKQRQNALRRESLGKKMTINSNCAFWKEIKKLNNANTPLPNCIAIVLLECQAEVILLNYVESSLVSY